MTVQTDYTSGTKLDDLRSALDELKRRGLWETLPEHDQAAVNWAMASGRCIGGVAPPVLTAGQAQRMSCEIPTLCAEVAHFASRCDPTRAGLWPEASPERSRHAAEAVELLRRYSGLPLVWRAEVLRQVEPSRERVHSWFGPAPLLPVRVAVPFTVALGDAAERAERGAEPPGPDPHDGQEVRAAAVNVRRLADLPAGWQIEAVRRVAAGVRPLLAVSDAAMVINIVQAYGVRLAWKRIAGALTLPLRQGGEANPHWTAGAAHHRTKRRVEMSQCPASRDAEPNKPPPPPPTPIRPHPCGRTTLCGLASCTCY
ncbi:hypothetical protein C7M71_014615 [Peterkaempfera bronchialis]|uniref:Uncharacterized protein n=1 Tax=Peterkaempfera bronchialis TaxID=2126346 RepID=A0A345SXM5_9ACTN|nr:hypothetical protein C7M71_014615 [Peterkaempfera bronchialis]